MTNTQRPFVFLSKITLLSFVLSALPLTPLLLNISPFWLLLFFTYWTIYFNTKGIFFIALILGVLLDVLQGDLLGQNALALILSNVFIIKIKQSFAMSNLSTQQIYVFIASSLYLVVLLSVHLLIQGFDLNYYLLIAPLSSSFFWPVVRFLLRKCQH